jgi:hypothetical protein
MGCPVTLSKVVCGHTWGPRLPALLDCMALWLGALASALPKLSAPALAKLSEDASVARLAVGPPCSHMLKFCRRALSRPAGRSLGTAS